ncbi:lysostaphin resistance A-like protein [Anaerobacillus isosaccharinicus]|uniref:CAAX protease family protein n=1 Tax=Anaerobacillus isosaccharinicus TaxID=1532552 RepID=A0A1S2M3Q6_9BACI|nr:type II CAAX endopeptidase family protein [Anaerobacillus isosaccharinicus]MBA5585805.1 CPBP family intramembrane metalloprotease [Anaerobacillus isosaccharinicus]QOY35898.1 CPBP family intramembrane metalloprotease [Anaerobacillus isosaccharinicus]
MKQADLIKKMTDKEILLNLYITQLLMLILAFGLGWFLFDSWADLFEKFKWDPFTIFVVGGGSAFIIILFELILEKILPKKMLDDGGINERVFQNRSVLHIFVLVTIIAFAEEILFRGVLQTHFGLIPASLLFAIIHVRYLRKIILFIITVGLSFYLGWLYLLTDNLLVPIFTHFTIDFVLGCILRFRNRENQV